MIVTDLNMPNMNGLEFIREVRKLPPYRGVPIVFLTTESDDGMKQQAKAAGATGWITKPFRQEQLARRCKEVFGMNENADPADIFRQESGELLEQLEQALLDLEQSPGDHDLINTAFRALQTIKGSGAMFGFEQVAAFTDEFESAFDRVRKGEAAPDHDLIAIALTPRTSSGHKSNGPKETDAVIGVCILSDLLKLFAGAGAPAPDAPPASVAEPAVKPTTGASHFRFQQGRADQRQPIRRRCSTSCAVSANAGWRSIAIGCRRFPKWSPTPATWNGKPFSP